MESMTRTQAELENFLREHGPYTEREVIAANLRVALEVSNGNRTRAAKLLGLARWTVLRRIGWLIQGERDGTGQLHS